VSFQPWVPHPGAQTEFLSRGEFEVLYGGQAGPGKTDCLVAGLTRDVTNGRYRGLIVRRTFPQLQEIIDRCWRLYPQMGGVFRATEKRWAFPSGALIDLGHMQHEDDKYNYMGKEYHRIGMDELTQFTETQYTYLFSRLRTTDPEIRPQIISTTNPGGIGHYWVKERFVTITEPGRTYFDPKSGLPRVFIPGKLEDNPTLMLNDPGYRARLEQLPEVEKLRLLHGIWDAFEGQVFTELSQRIHGCEDFDIPPEWERFCVLDWGYAKPFSIGWYAMDYDGVLYRYREWYGCKKEALGLSDGADHGLKLQAWEVAKGILDREKGEKIRMRVADPSVFSPHPESRKREARGPVIHEDFANEGVYFIKADNDREQGKLQVHKRLKPDIEIDQATGEVIDERPMLLVFNSCRGFWRTLPAMREDPKNPEDVDTDQEDHIYDEFRYMCMARPIKPKHQTRVPAGSFTAERNRLLRAKKYAQRHGVSVDVAYGRVH
jgi:hypothetical protein